MRSNRKLRVAIIGCGTIARDHVGTIQENCHPVELYFCDKNAEAAERLKKTFGSEANVYTDALQLLSNQEFDIVHVLTPPDSHYALAQCALRAKANVLVEKPMTLTFQEAQSLYDLAEQKGRLLCVNHSLLCMDCVLRAFELLRSGSVGRVISAHCSFNHAEKKKTIPYGGVSHWSYGLPGGPLLDLISHPTSVLVELLGRPDRVQYVYQARNFMPYGFADLLHVSFGTLDGIGSFTISMAHGNSSCCLNIECEKGSIYIDFARQLTIARIQRGKSGFISKTFGGIGQGWGLIHGTIGVAWKVATKNLKRNPGTRELVRRFYQAVREGMPPPVSKENALDVAAVIEKVLMTSSARGQIELPHISFTAVT